MIEISRAVKQAELQAINTIREKVFIEEQQVPKELEKDIWDSHPQTVFILAKSSFANVGCLRLRPYQDQIGKIERVAVLKDYRDKNIGRKLMEFAERTAIEEGYSQLRLNSQYQAKDFYLKLGYIPVGDIFEEAGILHLTMKKELLPLR